MKVIAAIGPEKLHRTDLDTGIASMDSWQTPPRMVAPLPTGTVTFLFTDIEGSTRLAQKFGADYAQLVADHFSIIRAEIEREDGVKVNTTGDGVFAVFPSAVDAMTAAAAIQRQMYAKDWPEGGDVKVRVGANTGEATVSDDDYVGVDVHKAARIMSAGHGGQVLTSEPTRLLAGDGFEFRSLGRHLLRGLETDESVSQLMIPGMPSDFPPLNTATAIPNNLPTRVSSIIGRDGDIEAITGLIDEHRLVTILGPGGVGKTSLAVTIGSRVVDGFPGGVTFVDLSGVSEPTFVIPSVASAIGVDIKTVEGLSERLGETKTLLVIDNFEQVVGAAEDIGRLMGASGDVQLLVTSQVPLRLPAEHRYVLSALQVNGSADSASVRLFYERARAADPSFSPDLDEVTALVGRLEGLPLAIELVASRANLLSPGEMLERLDEGSLTYSAPVGVPERHQSLTDALEWSYGLLDEVTQTAFRRLSVFAGDTALSAAEEVAGDVVVADALTAIGELVDRSLLVRLPGSTSRFRMLDGIRLFGRHQLGESGEAEEIEDRFVAYFIRASREAYKGLQSDKGEWWQSHLDAGFANLREVLSILHGNQDAAQGLELLGNTWRFYQSRGHLVEFELWLNRFFEIPVGSDHGEGFVKGLMGRAALEYWREEPDLAITDYELAVARARKLEAPDLIADALYGLGTSLIIDGRGGEAAPHLDEARAMYIELGDMGGLADIVAGDAWVTASVSGFAGLGPAFERSGDLYQQAGRQIQATQGKFAQAAVALTENRLDDARDLARAGLARGVDLSDLFLQTWGLEYAASVALEYDDVEFAGLLFGAAEAERERIGGGWGPGTIGLDNARDVLVERLGEAGAEELISPGRLMNLAEGVELALTTLTKPG